MRILQLNRNALQVSLIVALLGRNYGWPEVSGDDTKEGVGGPLLHAGTSETWAPSGAAFPTQGPWSESLLFTGLRGQTLYRAIIDSANPSKVEKLERHFARQVGRLRDILEGPGKALYVLGISQHSRWPGRPRAGE